MNKSTNDLESVLIEALENSSYIKYNIPKEIFGEISADLVKELTETVSKIEIKDDGFIAIKEDGDVIECPDFGVSIENDGIWLSELIPEPNFDTDMAGNVRKAIEAESAYTCAIISGIITDEVFKEDFLLVVKNYDFIKMDSFDNTFNNFSNLLEEWINLQSYDVNVIISAAKYRLHDRKKDTGEFLRDGIPQDSVTELRSLGIKIKEINRSYSMGILSPINVKNLKKIEILDELEKRDNKINEEIQSSNVEILYRLLNLSTEYVAPEIKLRLNKLTIKEVEKFYSENKDAELLYGDRGNVIKNWKRRYLKIAKLSRRKEEISKYLASPENFKMPLKR